MLQIVDVIKMCEIERKIAPPRITNVSRTQCLLEFTDLLDLSVSKSPDTSLEIWRCKFQVQTQMYSISEVMFQAFYCFFLLGGPMLF